jgi:hypothetical protein
MEQSIKNRKRFGIIRTIVKDIVKVFKVEDSGEFYLPNYLSDDDFYNFPGFENDLVVELVIIEDLRIDTFSVDANYYSNETIIEVIISYNPNYKENSMYDLIGELNEVITHEIRHIDQETKNLYDLNVPEELDPYKYYTQQHELDAQVYGFNRLSKLLNKPFDVIVEGWFNTHKDIHKLNDNEIKSVVDKIIDFKSNR